MRAIAIVVVLLIAACGESVDPPAGERRSPDLIPAPVTEFITAKPERGLPRRVQFTSTLVNVGSGDFVITAERDAGLLAGADDGTWSVIQEIEYTTFGSEDVPVDAEMVYGGDGHEHWHVRGIARYWLEPLDTEVANAAELPHDSKVGFCFFDFDVQRPELAEQTDEAVYTSDGCGDEGDRRLEMGLSVGWGDTYQWYLEGQSIDLTGLADGRYRMWAEVDPEGWFVEESVDNNITWSDIRLRTRESDGAPVVELLGTDSGS